MQIGYSGSNSRWWISATLAIVLAVIPTALLIPDAGARSSKMHENLSYEIVDVQAVSADTPHQAVRKGSFTKPDYVIDCDLLIAGGGVGGVAAALRASAAGPHSRDLKICLTEETDWIGGQMTAQGVSALDENYLVEGSGACRAYQALRGAIRNFYKQNYKLSAQATEDQAFNPGSCWVSGLAFEPKVALSQIAGMLKPAADKGRLAVYTRQKPIYARLKSGETLCAGQTNIASSGEAEVVAVGMLELTTGKIFEFRPRLCLDATELGDLLPLCGLKYSIGSDSRSVTGERHAPEVGDADNVEDFTYPFIVEYRAGEKHVIAKPAQYEQLKATKKFSFLQYKMFASVPRPDSQSAWGEQQWYLPFWEYRRLLAKTNFVDERIENDIAMINWESNDVRGENIIGKAAELESERLALGKKLSQAFLYWMQTEAPRDNGGYGYPELTLRFDVLNSHDGMSKFPYIRESRRVHAHQIILEDEIVAATNDGARAKAFSDSVGIGFYPVDIHGHQEVPGAGQATKPFQIPLRSLIPAQETNVFPSCKNIGTSHVTNGAYRLHPIEWAIGEAQGMLASLLLTKQLHMKKVFETPSILYLQRMLVEQGIPVYWFDDVPTSDPDFAAIQFLAISGIFAGDDETLHFKPNDLITRSEAATALIKVLPGVGKSSTDSDAPLKWCIEHNVLSPFPDGSLGAASALQPDDQHKLFKRFHLSADEQVDKIDRAFFARLVYQAAIKELETARR